MIQREVSPAGARTTAAPHFSIVIANYNYGRFVGRAIESALEQGWPLIEVIVVDDGSTDDSRAVIERYSQSVTAIFQPNSGQRVANNAGFARTSGDIVIFLDADDILDPAFARTVADAWRPGISKVQVRMARVDADERPLGSTVPPIEGAPSPEAIRRWARTTSEYPTPPGSGNDYARDFLERFFPIRAEDDSSTDSTCLALAPFLGDVVTIAKPLASYRQHGGNDSNLFADRQRFGREVARALRRQESAERICARLGAPRPDPGCIRFGLHLLQLRAASFRMDRPAHPFPGDSRFNIFKDLTLSLAKGGFERRSKRLAAAAWSILVLLMPLPLASRLIRFRFAYG